MSRGSSGMLSQSVGILPSVALLAGLRKRPWLQLSRGGFATNTARNVASIVRG